MRLSPCIALPWLLVSGCWFSADEHVQACSSDDDCASGFSCYAHFCLQDSDRTPAPDGGCTQAGEIESCYDGTSDTEGVGICQTGQRVCVNGIYTDCLGQVLPEVEICNGKDDDCNGSIDDVAEAACDTHLLGECAEGTLVCRAGVGFCQPLSQSQAETCNEKDDDCDGAVDEVLEAPCYLPDVSGCALDAQGSWQCQGSCTTGSFGCSSATGQTCRGATTPLERDDCTTGDDFAQDENCNGEIDEGCPCDEGDSRVCYAGPAGTNGHGICRSGTQTCVDLTWGPCADQIIPRAETCENENSDDDCNDVVDDVPGRNTPCVLSDAAGACRDGTLTCVGEALPQCIGVAPTSEQCDDIDQDCDGNPTNGFDLTSDATCGACDVQCSTASQLCCGAKCIERSSLDSNDGDPANCGACGKACGTGEYCCQGDCLRKATMTMVPCDCPSSCGALSCCGAMCRNLQTDKDNCGACGVKCGRGKTCVAAVCVAT